jgi:PPM family protein phosphatase
MLAKQALRAGMAVEIEFGAKSDRGCLRENNEDCYRLAPELNLFVLSDGMGGLTCGEIASALAVDTILECCREGSAKRSLQPDGDPSEAASTITKHLAEAVRRANEAVYHRAEENLSGKQMGATVVAVQFVGNRMSVAHIGDSRAYRLRGEDFKQLTEDHSFVEEEVRLGRMTRQEAGNSTMQNVLVRALGVDSEVEVDVSEEIVMNGDTVLLCSDGLTRELSDDQIAAVLRERPDPRDAASGLVDFAKQAGGADNITAIVLRPHAKRAGVRGWVRRLRSWFN